MPFPKMRVSKKNKNQGKIIGFFIVLIVPLIEIGIVGAGISGLFSALLLDQTGYHDYDILEANDKVGG